ncbi:unnamed protein product [Coffea canephora]|uniref:C2 NT-type domain-containing protein n=2 Tax=Coffea TaxID=13442 RepID=A0A068UY31_COFCA|nr:uncharacterized protein LOC113716806 [Coffea arabica]XP_027099966.1 uncharacterized protein LOC113719114 [Coffea arabica]CDP13321.1 unnamed protein product [Coffea canephora]
MVLGLRSKKKRGASVQIDYLINVVEIKPWPPSQSLRSVQSVLLQWQNGDQNSGSFLTVAGDANIAFNESFTLPVTLHPDKKARDRFQKNYLEFSLYEPRKEKATKEQLLGTAIINLSEFGVIEDILPIIAPLNFKKTSKSSPQPALYFQVEPLDKGSSKSSPNVRSSRTSLDQDGQEAHAEFNGDDSEIASFTDDDVSSHSSQTVASSVFDAARASPSQSDKNGLEAVNEITGMDNQHSNGRLPPSSSISLSLNTGHPVNNHTSKSKVPGRSKTSLQKNSYNPSIESSSSFDGYYNMYGGSSNYIECLEQETVTHGVSKEGKNEGNNPEYKNEPVDRLTQPIHDENDIEKHAPIFKGMDVAQLEVNGEKQEKNFGQDEQFPTEKRLFSDYKSVDKLPHNGFRRLGTIGGVTSTREALGVQISNGRLKRVKSQLYYSAGRSEYFGKSHDTERATNVHKPKNADNSAKTIQETENKESVDGSSNAYGQSVAENQMKVLRNESHDYGAESYSRIQMLEEELREAATLEIGLYSVVAEHGSSVSKVHAPARRLSRFYLHACKEKSRAKQASAARAAISGLVLVSKACGNDVPRLTFWLSNAIMLRVIVIQTAAEISNLEAKHAGKSDRSVSHLDSCFPKRQDSFSYVEERNSDSVEESDDWEDIETFIFALEKAESWVFSRIVESIWWQTITPHMQPTVAKTGGRTRGLGTKKNNASGYGLGDQVQGNFSIELWKKAFKDACERLCPIRAGGHECGCLPVMPRLVMEQLVSRLDVAMFNAILRESAEEMPSDPVSDPISDSRVLPIPAGKLSFGAGVQLKNAIGNWSRWLSDLFGIEDSESLDDSDTAGDDKGSESFKAFRFLNALSDLMMLPLEMLMDIPTRKEVCPLLGPTMIKKVLSNFVPDEFCPNPIPQSVIHALDHEDASGVSTESITSHPCTAPPTIYSPPPAPSLLRSIKEVGNNNIQRSGSSLLKKSYTSDDELDELDTRLTSIIADSFQSSAARKLNWIPRGNGKGKVSRYQLLRELWKGYEE